MIKLSKEKVLVLHELMAKETGGIPLFGTLFCLKALLNRRLPPLTAMIFTPRFAKKGQGSATR